MIARVRIACLAAEVSALGFGCASLGSRIAPAIGLRALERAFDAGVTWFDVAPSYGDGQAEALLGDFLKGKRDRVQVLTKVGIAPPAPSLKQRLLRPAMRAAVTAVPALEAAVRARRTQATKLPLTAAMIPAGLDASLKRLRTDHVDVLALHDATPDEAARDDIRAALADAVTAGKARAVAVASSVESARAGLAAGGYGLVQTANNPFQPGAVALTGRDADLVTHSVYGKDGAAQRIAARIADDAALRAAFGAAGYAGDDRRIAGDFLADYAFAGNPGGVVLVSMFKPENLAANVARHALPRDPASIARLATMIGDAA